jgi:hypothetical protein
MPGDRGSGRRFSEVTCELPVKLQTQDFNDAATIIARKYAGAWNELEEVLTAMPLHLKASDQAGIQGTPIFDAVGTNEHVKRELRTRGWDSGIPIPVEYRFLGTDVDFGKSGVVAEVQFSNYPFLLNNLMRSELLYKTRVDLTGDPTGLLVVVTKARMFPASQSTLYYEQAVQQVDALANNGVFDIPIRLVGLFEDIPATVRARWTEYHAPRYSRTVVNQEDLACDVAAGATTASRARLTLGDLIP